MAEYLISDQQLNEMDLAELENLQRRILKRTVTVEVAELEPLRDEYETLMEKIEKRVAVYGMTARGFVRASRDEVSQYMTARAEGAGSAKAPSALGRSDNRRIVVPRYRHPQNHALTWAGRGRTPQWVDDYLHGGEGRSMMDLTITRQDAVAEGDQGANGTPSTGAPDPA